MRAIDADKLIDDLYELKYTKESPSIILTLAGQEIYNSGVESAIGTILGAHTIDAVPVVRCKDCGNRFTSRCPMHHEEQTYNEDDGYDWIERDHTSDDGFCDQGEPETDDDL